MYGLDTEVINNLKDIFSKFKEINIVILYGSRAKGDYQKGSDIDLTLLGEGLTLSVVYKIKNQIEDLNLPYEFDISIHKQIDNQKLKDHINRVGKNFYQKKTVLPKGWEIKKLGEVCEIIAGQSPEGKFYNKNGNGLPFYQGKKEYGEKYIGEPSTWTTKVTKEAEANDILMSVRAPVGPINLSTQKICIGRGLAAIRVGELVDKEFLFNFLLKHKNEIISNTGAVFNSINKSQIGAIQIPIPPLPEQQRIVSILDKAFTAIAKAKANAEQNLKNAKELFESYLQGVFASASSATGWEEKTLGEIAKVIGGYSFKSKDFKKQGKYQVLRMGNIRPGIIREKESPVFISNLDNNVRERALLLRNDVIITPTGTKNKRDYGFTVIIDKDNYLLNQRISAIRFTKNYLPELFLYYSWTNSFKDQYFANETGTVGQGNVGIKAITEAIVPFPTISEQQSIVKKLDTLSAKTKKLETIYQQKIEELEELKKSILQKAFNGELKTGKEIAA